MKNLDYRMHMANDVPEKAVIGVLEMPKRSSTGASMSTRNSKSREDAAAAGASPTTSAYVNNLGALV